jgi:multidrug efflux pump subunit AcrB
MIEEQLDRPVVSAITFLWRQECWKFRSMAVVAVAVLFALVAGAMLYLGGYTLNLITMLGLAVGIGALVDNSVVVYEAVQRGLERGLAADTAAISAVQRTMRAIVAGSITHGIVFLPAIFLVEDSFVRGALELVAVAIIFPLFASLLVAIGLVPLLAERLAAPAALARWKRGPSAAAGGVRCRRSAREPCSRPCSSRRCGGRRRGSSVSRPRFS